MVIEIKSSDEYNTLIQSKGIVIIHFLAEWNSYDKTLKNILEELALEFGEKVTFCSLDIDQPQFFDLLRNLSLTNIPALAYFKDRHKIVLEIGLRKKEEIRNKIEKLLSF